MNWYNFIYGCITGAAIEAAWVIIWLRSNRGFHYVRRYVYEREEAAQFRNMPNPPDQGIEQRIYKPEGSPANITKNAIGRRQEPRFDPHDGSQE